MSKAILMWSLLLLSPIVQAIPCYVTEVVDGDTIKCLDSSKDKLNIRLLYIDAPEIRQEFGQESKKFLHHLIHKKQINVVLQGKDKYRRYLGEIWHNQKNINKLMVELGYAWSYYNNNREYLRLQSKAQELKLGLWKNEKPIHPKLFRKINSY